MGTEDGSTRDRGRAVEQFVGRYLEARGVEILDTNFEAVGAEVDLVGRTTSAGEELIVFVEIRSRRGDERGSPLETIDATKQRRVIRAATAWLVAHGLWEKVAVRFDAVGVIVEPGCEPQIEWIPGAFESDG